MYYVNYFDCRMAWRVIRLTEIFGSRAASSSKVNIFKSSGPVSDYSKELIIVCLTHSNIVAHSLYSCIPALLFLFQGKHSISP